MKFLKTAADKLKLAAAFMKRETGEKYFAAALLFLVLSFVCEIFIFNYKWIDSIGSDPVVVEDPSISGANIEDGRIMFSDEKATVSIDDIDKELKYLAFELEDSEEAEVLKITISAYDEANASSRLSAPQRVVTTAAKTSQYIPLHFSGNVGSMRIEVEKTTDGTVACEGITLNANVPLLISLPRMLLFAAILFVLYLLRPRSCVYKVVTDLRKDEQKMMVFTAAFAMAAIFICMIRTNPEMLTWHEKYDNQQIYYELVDALKDGHFYLNVEPSEELKDLENPYDPSLRSAEKASYRWDYAYYEGKYYVYFGAAPAVLLYLPYNLLTGNDLPNYTAVAIFGICYIAGVLFLLWEIIKKWFPKTPFALYILAAAAFTAPALTFAEHKPDVYAVPIISALAFAVLGTAFWLAAERTNKKGDTTLSPRYLCAGSICIALTAGCRPQFLIGVIFGVILFWKYVFKTRDLFSKKGLRSTIAVCAPFVVVGALVMIYNAARFGSPFDFGANYNLTTNDMTKRGFVWGRTGLGLFTYIFQPLHVDALFPFIHDFGKATAYQGLTLTEKLLGGVLWLYPMLLIGVFGLARKRLFEDQRVFVIVCASLAAAMLVAVADAQMAGLLTRYYSDFVWLMMIASSVTAFALYRSAGEGTAARATVVHVVTALMLLTIAFSFMTIFAKNDNPVETANPGLYYSIQHMIAFWL